MSADPSVAALLAELERVKSRLAEVEARTAPPPVRAGSRLSLLFAACVGLVGGVATAANGNCPNGLPFCFAADTPAQASQVNHNFAQLKEWLEQKVGATGTANVATTGSATVGSGASVTGPTVLLGSVRVQSGSTANDTAAAGKPLFISGNILDGATGTGGIEVRHDNLTQGIGIGFNTIYASGGATDQHLQLKARGGGTVNVLSDLTCGSNVWGSGPTATTAQNRAPCTSPINSRCPNGQYVCGLTFNHGCNVNWWEETFAIECCSL